MTFFVFAALFLLGCLTPDHFPPWGSWHSEFWVFAGVMFAGAHLLFWKKWKSNWVLLPPAVWPVSLLAFVVVIQTALGRIEFVGDAWVLLFYLMLCAVALAVGYKAGEVGQPVVGSPVASQLHIAHFAALLLLGGLGSVAIALVQSLDVWTTSGWIHRMPDFRRPGANLGQPNQLATLVLISVASLVYLFETRRLSSLAALPMAAILLLGLAVTESRTGALSLFLMAAWWMAMRRRIGLSLSVRAAALWILFFVVCLWYWPAFLSIFQIDGQAGGASSPQVNVRVGTRLIIWPQLWQAVLQRPWFGWGLREVSEAHNAVLHAYPVSEPFTYAHNLGLELAVGMGLPLTVLFMMMTGVWLWRRVRSTRDVLTWYCLAAALPFGVHSMLEFPFAYAYLLAPVMLLVGILEARMAPERAMGMPWHAAVAIWAFLSAAMAWSVIEYIAIEEDFRVARFEALRLGHTPGDYQRPDILLLTQLGALIEGPRIVPTPDMDAERIELVRRIALRFPGSAIQNRYALALALNGNPEEAIRQLKVIRAMHGQKAYLDIKDHWETLAREKHPQLAQLKLP